MSYVSPTKAFAHLDRLAAWRSGGQAAPVSVEWDLSNACSLGCQDCHFAHTHVRGPWAGRARALPQGYAGTGVMAEAALVRRGLGEAATAGVQAVIWSGGGEPTLHPEWLDIVGHAASLGLRQGMYTLGGHLTVETAKDLAMAADWVVVSMDAVTPEGYAAEKGVPESRFQAAVEGAHWLTNGSAIVGISYLIHAGNWRKTEQMLALARAVGADYATFRPAVQTSPDRPGVPTADRSWITDALPDLHALALECDVECDPIRFELYRDWKGHGYAACHGIKLATVVTPDGRMWVCPQRRGVEGSCIGDLREESWAAAWARHPREWTEFGGCRAMCRLHLVNQALVPVFADYQHEEFV